MSAIKNLIMKIEEFCDDYLYGDDYFTAEEVSEDAKKFFGSDDAGKYAENYIKKTLRNI
jgi:hypothetical protein|tara:strand:- start:1664 stop:1840 length:177 start_codon:yes stop_codon:yes gene_type:complete